MNINDSKKRNRSFNSSSSDLDTSSTRTPKKQKNTKHLTRKERKKLEKEKNIMADAIKLTLTEEFESMTDKIEEINK